MTHSRTQPRNRSVASVAGVLAALALAGCQTAQVDPAVLTPAAAGGADAVVDCADPALIGAKECLGVAPVAPEQEAAVQEADDVLKEAHAECTSGLFGLQICPGTVSALGIGNDGNGDGGGDSGGDGGGDGGGGDGGGDGGGGGDSGGGDSGGGDSGGGGGGGGGTGGGQGGGGGSGGTGGDASGKH